MLRPPVHKGCPQAPSRGASRGQSPGQPQAFFLIKKIGHQSSHSPESKIRDVKSSSPRQPFIASRSIKRLLFVCLFFKESNSMCSGNYFWGAGKLFIEDVWLLIRDNSALNTQEGGLSGGPLPGQALGRSWKWGRHLSSIPSGRQGDASCPCAKSERTAAVEPTRHRTAGHAGSRRWRRRGAGS